MSSCKVYMVLSFIFAMAVLLCVSYVVFVLGKSGWWFLLMLFVGWDSETIKQLSEGGKK